jgi:hypothetical protein
MAGLPVAQLREAILGKAGLVDRVQTRPDLYGFLGEDEETQAVSIANRIIPGDGKDARDLRQERLDLFRYIVRFLHRSTLQAPYHAPIGKGLNLARRPFIAPTGMASADREDGAFCFQEQYRWDTYFQNKLLILIGAREIAKDQLLNLVDVFRDYQRVPNALTTDFLSHPQPPLEAYAAADLLAAGEAPGPWYDDVMRMVEQELLTEWWDYGSGRINPRQNQDMAAAFGQYLTRYTSVHFHSLMAGCQDGKDHNWVTSAYGEQFLPVQLNALIWGNLGRLIEYYRTRDPRRAQMYVDARQVMKDSLIDTFWVDGGLYGRQWAGWRNRSLKGAQGHILYGDLMAELCPLFVGLMEDDPARVRITV